jgi:hypothetical protein
MGKEQARMSTSNAILEQLRAPFAPDRITFKPGKVARNGGGALGLAYADLRAYQERLDEVAGLDWSVRYRPWGERIICELTICGVTRASTGEMDDRSERAEIGGTVAEAQAFKRAAAMFGLGRYLYDLPQVWAEYDGVKRQFTEAGLAKLRATLSGSAQTRSVNGESADLRRRFHALGTELYGERWGEVCERNVKRVTHGRRDGSEGLTAEELRTLIAGMMSLMAQRQAA